MRRFFLLSAIIVSFFGCGGGGADGGAGSTRSADTGVRLMHASIDAVPVDVVSSTGGGDIAQRGAFNQVQGYARLSQGAQRLSLVPARVGGNELFGFDLSVEKKDRVSLLLYGSLTSVGLHAALFRDNAGERPAPGTCLLRVVHALVGANQLEVSTDLGSNFAPVSFGSASEYQSVSPGTLVMIARRAADSRVVSRTTISLADSSISTLVFGGEIDYFSATRLFDDS